MNISNSRKALLALVSRGYTVDEAGNVLRNGRAIPVQQDNNGYLCISCRFVDEGTKKHSRVMIHRIQAYQTYGDRLFDDGIVCRHLNSVKRDNSRDNIAIGTMKENNMDKPAADRLAYAINASSKLRRFNDDEIAAIRADHESGMSYNKLVVKYKVGKGTLSYIFNEARYNGLVPKPAKVKI